MTDRASNLDDQILELFRQLSPEQRKAALLSVILSACANAGDNAALDGEEAHT